MNRKHTTILKAIAILMVIWGHVGARLNVNHLQFIGGIGVSLFLICSGYGIFSSYKKDVRLYGIENGLKDYWKKKIVKVVIPFWLVETVGLLVVGKLNFTILIYDLLFIKPATAYGWYMQYQIICYIIFWLIIRLKDHFKFNSNYIIYFLLIFFTFWFIIETEFFINPDIPSLKARQMLSFPLGVIWCYYSVEIKNICANKVYYKRILLYSTFALISGLIITIITQISIIKSLPYLVSNTISLFTVLPIAVALILYIDHYNKLFNNKFILIIGTWSFELYLVHAFSLSCINGSLLSLIIFTAMTICLVLLLNKSQKGISRKLLSIADNRRYYG
jgi:peptidoglycan/LPS O-acetylase OafA/YrhL